MKAIWSSLMLAALCACHSPNQTTPPDKINPVHTRQQAQALLDEGVKAYERQNYTDAMTAFTQASAAGHMKAPRYIGLMYLNGYGVEKNARRAVAEFSKAAEWGDISGQYWLAYCYEQGIGVEPNRDEALKWYRVSAQRGDRISAPAMTALGRLAEADNFTEAAAWYRKAANLGDKEAQAELKRLDTKVF